MRNQLIRLMVVAAIATTILSAADPLMGTWKLNTAKSKYDPGPGPKSSTSTYSMDGDWVVAKVDSVSADGKAANITNRYKRDGKEYPYRGSQGSGTIVVKKVSDRRQDATLKLDSGTSNTVSEISADGKTRTMTTTGTNAKGKFHNVAVFDKQ